MKKNIFVITMLTLVLLTCITINAENISPGICVLEKQISLTKSAMTGDEIDFSKSDFQNALGYENIEKITVVSLPSKDAGTLFLGELEVMKNQIIGFDNLSMLRFIPANRKESHSAFRFSASYDRREYELECSLNMLSEKNSAPTAVISDFSNKAETYKNISVWGNMSAIDKEYDAISYEICTYPEHGAVIIQNRNTGSYIYTPSKNYTGKDQFSFRAFDKYGNMSPKITVDIQIKNNKEKIVFTDMLGRSSYAAAIEMTEKNLMTCTETNFSPDEEMTRCEFLVLCMNAAGYTDLIDVKGAVTVFEDEETIPKEYRGYVSEAFSKDMINGININKKLYFKPNETITRSEAAVIAVNVFNITGIKSNAHFADETEIPSWGQKEVYLLSSLGILGLYENDSILPQKELTRADAAIMISKMQ